MRLTIEFDLRNNSGATNIVKQATYSRAMDRLAVCFAMSPEPVHILVTDMDTSAKEFVTLKQRSVALLISDKKHKDVEISNKVFLSTVDDLDINMHKAIGNL